ncbi:MAG: 1-deoxy-D-xylulose-5-phosphate reductoisomerase [Bacilli bacterium]|jgi:1-deoxy-D-xylulose-5-phosphate reductoisomerase|nr:1-deoxy-D-xylulose-5-phosphate reductoisomerase [Bacilli bacterium]
MKRERILLLGATGSIGTQTLDLLKYDSSYLLTGVSLFSRVEILEPYLPYFDHLERVAILDEEKASLFQEEHPSIEVLSGPDADLQLLRKDREATVVNAILGNDGLLPSLLALSQDQDLLLSNKESLVIGSSLIKEALKKSKGRLYPIDSEHVGLAKLLAEAKKQGIPRSRIRKLIVTASGGALRDLSREEALSATPEQVLRHPTWSMGKKITVDCATLVNKGYEVIEAGTLFSFPLEKVGAIICRESLIHAELLYEDKDGEEKTLFEYSPCDMKVAISYALSKGKTEIHRNSPEDIAKAGLLHIYPVDSSFYPLFKTTISMYRKYGNVGMIYFNALDSLLVSSFLKKEIPFRTVIEALRFLEENFVLSDVLSPENLPAIEEKAKKKAEQVLLIVQALSSRMKTI